MNRGLIGRRAARFNPRGVLGGPMRGERIRDGVPWEDQVGYSRAVRVDERVLVSGTTATGPEGEVIAPEDPYRQAKAAMETVVDALEEAGASAADVVRTRMFVTDVEAWEAIGRAHAEVFGHARPATTMVEVERLIDEAMVVEVEAEAVTNA